MTRTATCWCGQLRAECVGEPFRVSVCHCLDCKRRSGSAFAMQARWPVEAVTITGEAREYVHVAESGNAASFHSCPICSATLWYRSEQMPDAIAIPVGNFADPAFPAPIYSVFEERKCGWIAITGDGIEHFD